MARKKKPEEHENHERWLISYADFITLLFAFFVVMYSVSSVNEGKYRVVSRSLIAAFGTPVKSLAPIQIGELVRSKKKSIEQETFRPPSAMLPTGFELPPQEASDGNAGSTGDAMLNEAAQKIGKAMQALIDAELVELRQEEGRLEVEIRSSVLFESGSGEVASDAMPVIESIAKILQKLPNIIHVEGFTDSVPINTALYPSNWELSAARSARVVRHLVESGLDPRHLVSIGYSEYQPIASNDTPEGRSKNRRVVLVVTAGEPRSAARLASVSRLATHPVGVDEVLAAVSLDTEPPTHEAESNSEEVKFRLELQPDPEVSGIDIQGSSD